MPKKTTMIHVGQRDIELGSSHPGKCPIARAIRRVLKEETGTHWETIRVSAPRYHDGVKQQVEPKDYSLYLCWDSQGMDSPAELPIVARCFAYMFDEYGKNAVQPITFPLVRGRA